MPVNSVADNFLNDNISIFRLSKELANGELVIKALLVYLISDVALFFEVGKNMGAEQVRQTADLILEDYSHFKPEDFKLCFTRAKKGHYGKLFDRLDGQIIMQWLMDYDNERDNEIVAIRAKENRQLKQSMISIVGVPDEPDELFTKNMAILRSTLLESKLSREKEKAETPINYDPIYLKSQQWLSQFDLIWKRQGYPKSRLIKRYGVTKNPFYKPDSNEPKIIHRKIAISQYLEHKHWQYILAYIPRKNRLHEYLKKYPGVKPFTSIKI